MLSFRGIIPILIAIILYPLNAQAGDLTQGRLIRTQDAVLRNRLATAHLVRGEPIDVIAIAPAPDKASATDHFNTGLALSLTGRYIQASEAFRRAIINSEPGDEIRSRAVTQFLELSSFNPSLKLPPGSVKQGKVEPDLSLALSGYLADQGDRDGALSALGGSTFRDDRRKIISGILTASHLAANNSWDASARQVGKVKGTQASTLVDLLYLSKGYHYLQAGQANRARSSFTAITLTSPYSPDGLLGKAWSLIQTSDLQGATIVLEELIELHRYSRAARDGVLDLALIYRELGLYDKAAAVLGNHQKRLEEVRNWLLGLRDTDLQTGSEIVALLEHTVDGSPPDPDLLHRTPYFVRQWVMDIAADPDVSQPTALLNGLELTGQKAAKLGNRLARDGDLVKRELDWAKEDISGARATSARLEEIRNELKSIREDTSATLQNLSLDGFASEKARTLISRTGQLKERLSFMENSVSKAEGFTNLVGRLAESVTASKEENQLNRTRKQAYDGIISSRLTLRSLKSTLTALEGQLWLGVKSGAIQLEKKISLRVTSGRTRAGQALANTSKSIQILSTRQKDLEELARLILTRRNDLNKGIPERLEILREKIDTARAARLLDIAAQAALEIREAEARTLYTSADIEISKMENTVRLLQEAVQ